MTDIAKIKIKIDLDRYKVYTEQSGNGEQTVHIDTGLRPSQFAIIKENE